MFTGIIKEVGEIAKIEKIEGLSLLYIKAKDTLVDAKVGDSISVNGVCLTVASCSIKEQSNLGYFVAEVMNETFRRSNFSSLAIGTKVNLEAALTLQDHLGGHFVSGHVDKVAKISKIQDDGKACLFYFELEYDPALLVEKGSITLNGTSLTLVELGPGWFSVSLIPHTRENTVFCDAKVGDEVNVEYDLVAKYIQRNYQTYNRL